MEYGIGIDMGGTHIKSVVMNETMAIIDTIVASTLDGTTAMTATGSHPVWAEAIKRCVSDIIEKRNAQPSWVGLSAPGLVRSDNRCIQYMPGRLKGLETLDWTEHLTVGVPVYILNDAQAALYGETKLGSARGMSNVVLLTLGTGVGGAIMLDGKLIQGSIGRAGHIGHMSLDFNGPPDICGMPGSIEDLVGDHTISARTKDLVSSTAELVALIEQGNERARMVWTNSVRALAVAIASIINILDPETILITGGLSKAGENLMVPLRSYLDIYEWRPGGRSVNILQAVLGEYSGAIGVACFAKDVVNATHTS